VPYPDDCVKGIKDPQYVVGGRAATAAFHFDRKEREDGWKEQSINWVDDPSVINFTLNDKRTDGMLRYKGGVTILPRLEIDKIKSFHSLLDVMDYERNPLKENPFHGNILLKTSTLHHVEMQIAASLALASRPVQQIPEE